VATDLTIEQLAAATGMTVRNIRAHQARGLLAPPQVRLRVGYYGFEHVTQLELIRDLQAQGFNLAGIKRLLDDTPGTGERLARFREALAAARMTEPSPELTLSELSRRFHVAPADAPRVLARAERLGVLVPAGEDRYEVLSPALLAIAERIVDRGIALDDALAVSEAIFDERMGDQIEAAFGELTRRLAPPGAED
jgi:DNA-binding transcriptional MerR regulator